MMLFRIQDVSGFSAASSRIENSNGEKEIIKKAEFDRYIAKLIREEINGAKHRRIFSYSKSLATCLLKYNKYTDNELHICQDVPHCVEYFSSKGHRKIKRYFIENTLTDGTLFNDKKTDEHIQLTNFVIDVSDNNLIDCYFVHFFGVHLKKLASPEKDKEVVIFNPQNVKIIKYYVNSVYILYGLQMKYKFLCDEDIRLEVIREIYDIDDFRFLDNLDEREAFIDLINYLSYNFDYEYRISENIYDYSEKREHYPLHYDPILQFHDIKDHSFEEVYHNSDYNDNVLSRIFWKYCGLYLGYDCYFL